MALSYSPLSTVTSPMKSADFKELEELASTDSGEESVAQQLSFSADSASSDGEALASSDGEALDDTHSHADTGFLVYSTAILLQLRAAFGKVSSPSSVTYGTRSYAELPQELPAPQQTRTPAAAGSKQQNRTRAAVASQNKEKKSPAVRSESGEEDTWRASPNKKVERTGPPAALAPRTSGDDEKVARAVRSVLNKLTVEKFDALYEQLATCGVETPGQIAMLMRDVFEKATAQHHFISMYADLCVRLEADPRIKQAAESEGQSNSFRRLLLGQCQSAFEQLLELVKGEDNEEKQVLRKNRALGNVKLVGQIMNRGMLSTKILCGCADALLAEREDCPEALESLAAFLTVVGGKFDDPSWPHYAKLEAIFCQVRELSVDKKVPSRMRFLLRDVLDLRKAGWPGQMRPTMLPAGPMKLDEVQQQRDEEQTGRTCPKSPQRQPARPGCKLPEKAKIGKARDGAWRTDTEKTHKASTGKDNRNAQKSRNDRIEKTAPTRRGTRGQSSKETTKPELLEPRAEVPAPASKTPPVTIGCAYEPANFHRGLVLIMRELAADRDVAAAVEKVREWCVPSADQASEFANILTRALEENRGPARRASIAFAAALTSSGAFLGGECAAGARLFFDEVFDQLCGEVPQLPSIAAAELVPALRGALPVVGLRQYLPEDLLEALS